MTEKISLLKKEIEKSNEQNAALIIDFGNLQKLVSDSSAKFVNMNTLETKTNELKENIDKLNHLLNKNME